MNVTLMIGNGFDLNLGLSTRYSDFIETYRTIQIPESLITLKFKTEIIARNLPLWSNAEMAFGKQTSFISSEFTVEDYCKCHEHFCRSLAVYLIKEQNRFILNKGNATNMEDNFSKAVNNLLFGFRAAQREELDNLFAKYGPITFNFIDFNYTNTLDKICLSTNAHTGWKAHGNGRNIMGNLIHVHGTVEKDMVLGVNDETQIANLEPFKSYDIYYLAQLIKSQTDRINEENTYNRTVQVLNSSHFIYIYGMSIGDTDKFWWRKLCNLLIKNEYLHVVIHCFETPKDELLRFDVKRYEDKVKKRFFDFGEVKEEQRKSIQNRLHITGANIFGELKDFVIQSSQQAKAS